MLDWLRANSRLKRKAGELYGGVVAAARQPVFYGKGRAADTPQGRFEMVALHLFLLAERLMNSGGDGARIAQALIEAFVTDMDDCMREMGVGDLKVPKQVKQAAAVFYKRSGAYRQGLAQALSRTGDEAALAGTLQQALGSRDETLPFAAELAAYMTDISRRLAELNVEDIVGQGFSLSGLAKMR